LQKIPQALKILSLRELILPFEYKIYFFFFLKDDYTGYNVLNFRDPEDDEKWLDFVCDCRDGKEDYKKYDIIIGGVANDDVFKFMWMMLRIRK
jgi:hypothetical protein